MPAPLPLYKSNLMGGSSGLAVKSPTPEYDKLKAYTWMDGLCGSDPSCRATHICASADAAARQQGKLVLPTAEEAAAEAALTAQPHGACCEGCAHGTGCAGSAPTPLPPISASMADLTGPCGGLPYDDEAATVYTCCAAQSPRPRVLRLPTPEEAAAEVAAEGAGSARLRGCESPRAALRAPMSGVASPRCGSLGLPVSAARPTCAHPCSPNYSRGGHFNPMPTNRCDPDCTASPKRPVSPICRREFVDANVRDRPFSSTLPGSAYAPLCSPPKAPEPLMAAPPVGRRYSSPPPVPGGCSAWPGSAALPSRPMSPSAFAARPYLRDLSPDYARPLSPARPAMAPAYMPTASNLLPTGPGLTDGRHLQALSPGRRTYCSPFYEPYNVRNTSPRASYLDHLARIEEETQRLRAELRGF